MLPLDFRLGALAFRLDADTGMVRNVRFHGHEVLRGIYPAVRDEEWRTHPPHTATPQVSTTAESVALVLTARVEAPGATLDWEANIAAHSNGDLRYAWTARSSGTLRTNRTGLCVLHPAEVAGLPCRVEHTDGRSETGFFPSSISPHQPFLDLRGLAHEFAAGAWATVRFGGDVFEMEDQRNWTDASFKTYPRPLAWPRPYELQSGATVTHCVTLQVSGRPAPAPVPTGLAAIRPEAGTAVPYPELGFRLTAPLSPARRERVARLCPAHLRVDTPGDEVGLMLAWAGHEAAALGCALELAVHGPAPNPPAPSALPVGSSVLLFDRMGNAADEATVVAWRQAGHSAVGTGTSHHFTELNRNPPSSAGSHTGIAFGINAQVHAFDDDSLLETLTQHSVVLRQAQSLAGGRPVAVSPITLGPTPESDDPRLHTSFGAVWTLGSLARLAQPGIGDSMPGAQRIITFKLDEPGGFLAPENSSPLEDLFLSLAGARSLERLLVSGRDSENFDVVRIGLNSQPRILIANRATDPLEIDVPFQGRGGLLGLPAVEFTAGPALIPARSLWQLELPS